MRLFYLFLTLILLLFCQYIVAQPAAQPMTQPAVRPIAHPAARPIAQPIADTIRPGKTGLIVRALKPGLRQYLLCYQNPKTNRQLSFWYWLREISIGKQQGKDVFIIDQLWYGSDTTSYRSVYSINAAGDFAPLYHKELVKGKLNAYNWAADGIKGADSVEGNVRKDFSLAFAEPGYNWNLDIETFEMLPLAEGKVFLINFYDAGYSIPKYIRYVVTGSEKIRLLDGVQTDCWILHNEDTGHGSTETYWISKRDHQFLKEEDHFNGMIRYKIRLPDMMPDIRAGFDRISYR